MSDENLTKVVLEVEYDDGEVLTETPWAEDLGNRRYRLRNCPFYADGVSFGDIIEAEPKYENDDRPYLKDVVEKSGHKTLRILLAESIKESESSQAILDSIRKMKCGYEGTDGTKFFVVNITPEADFWSVCQFLSDNGVDWEHADPPYEALYPEDTHLSPP